MFTLQPETVLSCLYFQSSCENQGVYQMGCNMLVSCPGPATHMPRAGHPQFSSQTGNMCYMGFEPITICMYMEVNQISCWILYIFHQYVLIRKIWKNLLYYLLWARKNICISNNECSSIMKTNQKDLQWMCCRECKKEPSVGWPMDQGWDNIRKASRPFPMSSLTIVNYPIWFLPCPLLTTISFAYFILTCFMPQACWNYWNFLSFIGLETSHRRGPEKRSVIDVATSIIDGIDTGVNFLLLWGRKRALKWRLGPIG